MDRSGGFVLPPPCRVRALADVVLLYVGGHESDHPRG